MSNPPPLALRYVRAAVLFLIYGMSLGLHTSAALYMGWGIYRASYRLAHVHVLMIGFALMLLAGLALWRFPEPAPGSRPWIPAAAWWLLVATVVTRSSAEILEGYYEDAWIPALTFGSSCVQFVVLSVLSWHLLARLRVARG